MDALTTAVESIDKQTFDPADEQSELIFHKVYALLVGYHHQWKSSGYVTEATEATWHLPIVNPESSRTSRTFTQAGKVDGIVWIDGKRYMIEHKSTSEDIADPTSPYWRRLSIDCQVSMYGLALWQSGMKIDGTVYDVVRKPTIRPKELAKGSAKKPDCENLGTLIEIEQRGTYFGGQVPGDTMEAIRNGWTTRETPLLYRYRLIDDIIARPANYYQRRIVPRLDADLWEWSRELWDVSQEMKNATNQNRHYRNSEACIAYGRPCEYLTLCSGADSQESDNWVTADVHQELEGDFGQSVITCSRIKCFQTCRRKHFYRYLCQLRKRNDEESEALQFGRLLHIGLENWFNCFKEERTADVNCHQPAANGVASAGNCDDREESSVACGDPWG